MIDEDLTKTLGQWLKNNFGTFHAKGLKYMVETIHHEFIHQKIYEKFSIPSTSYIILDPLEDEACGIGGRCRGTYEITNIRGYFKQLFVEFNHLIYDCIHDIARLRFFQLLFFRISIFLEALFDFRRKKGDKK